MPLLKISSNFFCTSFVDWIVLTSYKMDFNGAMKLLSENEKLEKQQKKLQQELNKMVQSKEVMECNMHAYVCWGGINGEVIGKHLADL